VGQEVDISLFHTGVYQASFDASGAAAMGDGYEEWRQNPPGEDPERRKRRLELIAETQAAIRRLSDFYMEMAPNPIAGHYVTKDDRRLIFNAMHSDRYWPTFCAAIGRDDLAEDARYNTLEGRAEHNTELRAMFTEVFRSRTLQEWIPRLHGLPFSPLQNLSEVIKDPQAIANDVFPYTDHPVHGRQRVIASPVNLSETPATIRTAAPEFSQHTEEILLEAGYGWEDIASLKEQGAIA
jgi:crotonobetainyl-CoA:carnitine CoA-transferase CaiB-like acyl-CoA transferase